jgi:hypothetical protein
MTRNILYCQYHGSCYTTCQSQRQVHSMSLTSLPSIEEHVHPNFLYFVSFSEKNSRLDLKKI